MKKVLIFGVSGFAGSYLSKEFSDYGYEVYGSDKSSPPMHLKETIFHNSDLLDQDQVEDLVKRIRPDMIVNLAAVSSVGASWKIPQATMMVNVVGALNVMEAARKQKNMPKVMFIGSSEEYEVSGQPLREESRLDANNPYGILRG